MLNQGRVSSKLTMSLFPASGFPELLDSLISLFLPCLKKNTDRKFSVKTTHPWAKVISFRPRFRMPVLWGVGSWILCKFRQRTWQSGCRILKVTFGPCLTWRTKAAERPRFPVIRIHRRSYRKRRPPGRDRPQDPQTTHCRGTIP